MSEWISVDERLPEKECDYLVCDYWNDIFILRWYGHFDSMSKITHWQPLPPPPKED